MNDKAPKGFDALDSETRAFLSQQFQDLQRHLVKTGSLNFEVSNATSPQGEDIIRVRLVYNTANGPALRSEAMCPTIFEATIQAKDALIGEVRRSIDDADDHPLSQFLWDQMNRTLH
jgi:ribosome-associated translation inhibitor RaiA